MMYAFGALFFLLGLGAGWVLRARVFHVMADEGQLVFKCGSRWVGEDEAFAELRRMFIK